ncbi:MAG: hypothetical protein AAF960_05570 [Bacteroidota bacterium]
MTAIDVKHLNIQQTPYDFRRDLFLFMQYCQTQEIKRTVYGNLLSKSEYKRIAKKLGRPELMEEYEKEMGLWWIDYLDQQALKLGWISYDTKGEYLGYTSSRPAFQDNYIEVNTEKYEYFLSLSGLEQEKRLLRHFQNKRQKYNLLMSRNLFNLLDSFTSWGSATGVLPTLSFVQSKLTLIDVLADLSPNTWYATSDLIQLMKEKHPWFLIPEKTYVMESGGWRKPQKKVLYPRYYNFIEGDRSYSRSMQEACVQDNDPKGFEKVEGRFIERFLVDYLFTLGYVEVAFTKEKYRGVPPEMETLQAFRLQSTFFSVLKNEPLPTKVSVQPNFEIYIDSPVYPTATLTALEPLTKVVKEDQQIILKLEKQHVLQHIVEHPTFDIKHFLADLSDTPLPQNVEMELKEWTERTDVFTLYEGFGLYEGLKKQPLADIHTELSISPTLRLVRRPKLLYEKLQKSEVVPMLVEHQQKALTPLSASAKSIFPKVKIEKAKQATKQKIAIERTEILTYTIGNSTFYNTFLTALLSARLPITFDKTAKQISFPKSEEKAVKATFDNFKEKYQISIKKR